MRAYCDALESVVNEPREWLELFLPKTKDSVLKLVGLLREGAVWTEEIKKIKTVEKMVPFVAKFRSKIQSLSEVSTCIALEIETRYSSIFHCITSEGGSLHRSWRLAA